MSLGLFHSDCSTTLPASFSFMLRGSLLSANKKSSSRELDKYANDIYNWASDLMDSRHMLLTSVHAVDNVYTWFKCQCFCALICFRFQRAWVASSHSCYQTHDETHDKRSEGRWNASEHKFSSTNNFRIKFSSLWIIQTKESQESRHMVTSSGPLDFQARRTVAQETVNVEIEYRVIVDTLLSRCCSS